MNEIQKTILEKLNGLIATPRKGVYGGHYTLHLSQFDKGEIQKEFSYLVDERYIKKEKRGTDTLYYISSKGINFVEKRETVVSQISGSGKQYMELFKKFETKLREIAGVNSDSIQFKDILDKAKRNNPLVEYKEDLIWDLYGLRNVFAHCDRDKYIAEVNSMAFEELNKLYSNLENPPKVIDLFAKEIFRTRLSDDVLAVLESMKENVYTHVPVYDENDKFVGILSETTVMNWLIENLVDGKASFSNKTMGDFNSKYLHTSENKYEFVASDFDIFAAQKMFDSSMYAGERLGCIIITQSGNRDEKPIGIITAWDLPKIRDFLK